MARLNVVLFIGHHKVGSSALQEFLSQNALALMRAGILYPAVEAEGMAINLRKALTGREVAETLPINAREAHNALAFRMLAERRPTGTVPPYHENLPGARHMLNTIAQQIEALEPRAVVLTAEVFANFRRPLVGRLAEFFKGSEIRILVTLRRIDDYIAAWHGQRLRFGHKLLALSAGGLELYFKGIHFNYARMLEGWVEMMPEATFVLRDYKDVLAAGGSIADFQAQSGLDFPDGLLPVDQANPSLHRGLVDIARRGNHLLEPHDAATLRRWLGRMAKHLDLPPSRQVELFGPAARAEMAARFAPIHQEIGRIAGRTPFFADIDKVGEVLPFDQAEVTAAALAQLQARKREIAEPRLRTFIATLDLKEEVTVS